MGSKSTPNSKPTLFGQPQKRNYWRLFLFALVIAVGIAGIWWMLVNNLPEKALHCRSDIPSSLISFGDCTTE